MNFLNKAVDLAEKHAGGKSGKKHNGSILIKALDAVEKCQVKEKAIEYAQKQVAKREDERFQAGMRAKKEKSIVNKAKEAAEDFLAKQGDKTKIGRSSYSSNGYSNAHGGSINDSFGNMNLNHSGARSSGRGNTHYETYEEYWSRQGNAHTDRHRNFTGDSHYASTNYHHAGFDTSLPQASHVHATHGGARQHLNCAGTLHHGRYPSGRENNRYQTYEEYYRRDNDGKNYPNTAGYDGRSSGYGTRMPGNSSQPGMQYGSYAGHASTDHV